MAEIEKLKGELRSECSLLAASSRASKVTYIQLCARSKGKLNEKNSRKTEMFESKYKESIKDPENDSSDG